MKDKVKAALRRMLQYLPPDEIAYRRASDGAPVSISEMISLLDTDDPDAQAFLEDVYATAVRAVGLRARRTE